MTITGNRSGAQLTNIKILQITKNTFLSHSYAISFISSSYHKNLYISRSVELQYMIFEKSNKVENEKRAKQMQI